MKKIFAVVFSFCITFYHLNLAATADDPLLLPESDMQTTDAIILEAPVDPEEINTVSENSESEPIPADVPLADTQTPTPSDPIPDSDPQTSIDPIGDSDPQSPTNPIPEISEPLPELPPAEPLFIFLNEILADPDGDEVQGEFIELYNSGPDPLDLSGYRLDDARTDDGSYTFLNPDITYVLEPQSYMVLYRSETHITLNNDGDTVYLFDASGKEIDSFAFGSLGSNHSVGRNPDNHQEWLSFKRPTPGLSNVIEPNSFPLPVIDIQQDTRYMKLNVTGDNSSDPDGDPLSFLWQFEEGVFDTRSNPLIYEYKTPGSKTVSLTVTDIHGASATTYTDFLATLQNVPPSPSTESSDDSSAEFINHLPIPVIDIQKDTRHMKLNVTGENSYDLDGDPLNFLWEFEEGITETRENPLIYEYKTPGVKTLRLTVTDLHGASSITEINFEAIPDGSTTSSGTSAADHTAENHSPIPIIAIQKDTRNMKLNVTGESSSDPDSDKLTFLWEFEPGFTDTRENPLIYEYKTPGLKLVKLTITDSRGVSATATITFVASSFSSVSSTSAPDELFPSYSLINEVLPSPEGKDDEHEWVELYNPNNFGIDLSGWYLDDAEGASSPYRIPDDTVITPYGYMLFSAPDLELSFNNSADTVRLLDPNKKLSEQITYSDVKENWSYSKSDDGSFRWTPLLTPAQKNEFPAPPRHYQPSDVVFESVLPNPEGTDTGNEKIILKNKTDSDISLLGWIIEDGSGSEKSLPDLLLEAGQRLTLSSADFKLSLNNSNEELLLFDPLENFIDKIKWKTSASGQWLFNPDALLDNMEADVVRVIDGDTFVIHFDDKYLTVRMLGIDTPETVHPFKSVEYFGKQASRFLNQTLSGQLVKLQFDENKIDKYGRVLAYVYLDDQMINRQILEQGFGYAYTRFPFKLLDEFVELEKKARENKAGMWADNQVSAFIDELILAEDTEAEEEIPEDLLPVTEEIAETEELKSIIADSSTAPMDCSSDFLKIDSFLPNAQKGTSLEYIKIINIGSRHICLNGWTLDDQIDAGSKPFLIKGGGIEAGGSRMFRKQETKLSLNNRNDCATLIAPNGLVADQICYQKTHPNEIFTHVGGDWRSKPKTKKSSSSSIKASRFSFLRDFFSYQSDLPTTYYTGKITSTNEENQHFVLTLETNKIINISYANSPINLSVAQEMIDFSQLVKIGVYESEGVKNLLSIESAESRPDQFMHSQFPHVQWTLVLIFLFIPYIFRHQLLDKMSTFKDLI